MKRPVVTLIACLVLELFLALSPFIPWTAEFWQSSSPQDFYNKLAFFIGLQFVLLTFALGLLFLKEFHDIDGLRKDVQSKIPGIEIRRLSADEFYNEFRAAIKSATRNVSICYFAPYPPQQVSTPDQQDYYNDLVKTIRRSKKVSFRRIIRDSEKNKIWVRELAAKLVGRKNAYVAVLREDLSEQVAMPLALSIQIIDGERSWLVALKTHEREARYRDVFVDSREFAEAMADYFDRLWGRSLVVLEHGQLTATGIEYLRDEANGK